MKKQRLLLFASVLIAQFCLHSYVFGQKIRFDQKLRDSLIGVIHAPETHDTIKALLYYEMARSYYFSNIDTFKIYTDSGLHFSRRINYKYGEANTLFFQGAYYRLKGQYDSVKVKMHQALNIFSELNDPYNAARCYVDLGSVCRFTNKLDSALFYFEKASEMFGQIGKNSKDTTATTKNRILQKRNKGQAAAYVNMGLVYKKNENFALAIQKMEEAIKLYSEVLDYANCALTYSHLGNIYNRIGDYPKSIESYIKTAEFAKKSNNQKSEARAYAKISEQFFFQDYFSEALEYAKKSLQLYKQINHPTLVANSLNDLAKIYLKVDSLDKSMKLFRKALNTDQAASISKRLSYSGIASVLRKKGDNINAEKYFEKALDVPGNKRRFLTFVVTLNSAGGFYLEIGKTTEAKKCFEEALQTASRFKRYYHATEAAKGLADLHEKVGDRKKALLYYKKYHQYSDSAANKDNAKKIVKETLNFEHQNAINKIELEQKKKDLLAEQEKAKQIALRNSFLTGFLFLLLLSIVIFISLRRNRKKNKELAIKNNEIEQQKAHIQSQNKELLAANDKLIELDQFKEAMTGMIVHDLKNPLNAIINISPEATQFSERVKYAGKQMLNMVLNILDLQKYENTSMLLELNQENLHSVLENAQEEVRFLCEEKNIKLEIETTSHFAVLADKVILNRILVNLLTNAIKFSPNNENINVKTISLDNNSKALVEICDKGPGISENEQKNIFERFAQQQAKDSGTIQSTGLGLTFCKLAVEAHGGEIGVNSEIGKGSCFWFTLQTNEIALPDQEISSSATGIDEIHLPKLTTSEVQMLTSELEQLKATKIYQISQLRKILSDIDENQSESVKCWKDSVEKAIKTEDQETFGKLISNS